MNEQLCESKKRMNIWEKLMFIQKNFSINPQTVCHYYIVKNSLKPLPFW